MQSQTILFPEKVGEYKTDPHCQETHDPQMGIREVLHHGNPLFHLIRKGKVGKAFYNQHKTQEAQKKFHPYNGPQKPDEQVKEMGAETSPRQRRQMDSTMKDAVISRNRPAVPCLAGPLPGTGSAEITLAFSYV